MVRTQLKEEESIWSLSRYSEMVGTVNSRKMKGGVFKKLQQQSNKPAGEFTIRDTQVDNL